MRRVRYNVAASLDGFIADAKGGFDWIPTDPTVDFAALFARIDTVLIGRRTWDMMQTVKGAPPWREDARIYVFSRTLRPELNRKVTIVADDAAGVVSALRHEEGDGEIWLFGGGELFHALLEAGQVDSVEVTVAPVLLGTGIPLLGAPPLRSALTLTHSHVYPSGMVGLHYDVVR